MRFCDKLPKLRKDNNLSQEQLAERLNVSRQAVSKWESGASYPDMEKLLQMCKILNCTLEDIMDDGSVNPNSESKSRKQTNITDYLNSFLSVITRTYNMFCSMNWKARLVCLAETFLIAVIVWLGCWLVYSVFDSLFFRVFNILPYPFDYYISLILDRISLILLTVLGIITFLHLFKIRYLDYYITVEDSTVTEKTVEAEINDVNATNKIGKPKNAKIIIRDPKHSVESLFRALGKMFTFFLKMTVIICAIPAIIGFALSAFGVSVLAYNAFEAISFLWLAFSAIGIALLFYIIIHLAYNYIFKRAQPYKLILIILISGLILTGCGFGIFIADMLTFSNIAATENMEIVSEEIIIEDVTENTQISAFTNNIEYIIDDNTDGIIITATYPEELNLHINEWPDNEYHFRAHYDHNFLSLYKILVEDIKNNEIRSTYNEYEMLNLEIRLSQESFDKVYYVE